MSVCTSSSTSVKVEVSNSGQLCVSKIGTSEPAIWFSLFLAPEPKVLHKGLVKVGTLNVTPPTSRRRDWGFEVEWSDHPVSNVPPNLSDEESILVWRLKGIISTSRAIRNLTEEWLVEAGLSLASRGMP
ncbi:hypothetical protein BHM03_00048406 [Ensete ventricosum]|nr:hypothetical protein BHM03_00048406 [Ensete ventricosum]